MHDNVTLFSNRFAKDPDFEIETLLEKGALKIAKPCSDQFISNLFLVPKRDGTSRPIINLKELNLKKKKFFCNNNNIYIYIYIYYRFGEFF